jgi:hypothetical protein
MRARSALFSAPTWSMKTGRSLDALGSQRAMPRKSIGEQRGGTEPTAMVTKCRADRSRGLMAHSSGTSTRRVIGTLLVFTSRTGNCP